MFTQNGLDFINKSVSATYSDEITWDAIAYDGSTKGCKIRYSQSLWTFAPGIVDTNFGRTSGTIGMISNNSMVYYNTSSYASSAAYYGVILGDGDTPPSVSDYCLSGNMITTFSATVSLAKTTTNGKVTLTATYNITNTGADPITIKEIGITKDTGASTQARILIARDLLTTPVTIAPGDTGVVTYKLEIH